ncbi:MAG: phage late control D family protein [Deltaproteobacteria bacterium]|nr:phage late control D family protein [Deltaproteobacteria bacterium]
MADHNYADFSIKIDDETIKASDGMEISAIVVDMEMDKIDACTIEFAEVARGVLSGARHKIGDTMQVDLGHADDGNETLFKGECIALEPRWPEGAPASLVVRGMDRLHRLKRGTAVRFWEEIKDSDIVAAIAAEVGLSADVDSTSETRPYVLQNNVSNGEFIKALARRNGYEVSIDDSKISFKKPGSGGAEIELGYEIELIDCRMRLNAISQVSEVIVRGWDMFQKKEITGKAKTGDVSKGGGNNLGADLAKKAFGDATAYVTSFPVANQGEANALAKALISGRAGQFLQGSGRAVGNPAIVPGSTVNLKLLGDYTGKYTVHAARHIIGPKGYVTDFEFSSNTDGSGE